MKLIIAGSRTINDFDTVARALDASGFVPTEIVSGRAPGVDTVGEMLAARLGLPVKPFPADWSMGRKAGPIRNGQMAKYADALVAVWDGSSSGTQDMISKMKALGKPVFVFRA